MEYSAIIRKKNNGYQYVITYKINGVWKQKSKQGFIKKGEAQIAMDKMIPELEKMVKNNVLDNKVTFKKFYDMYVEHLKLYRQHNTILKYQSSYNYFDDLKDKELSKITTLDIQKCIDKMVCKGLRSSTVEIYLNTFLSVLKASKDEYKLITEIPTFNLKYKTNKKEKRALNDEEIKNLLSKFRKDYYLIILFALEAGLRIGEIAGLTWNDIDFENELINVNKQWKKVNGEYTFGSLKSSAGNRRVPLSNNLKKQLKSIKVRNIDNRLIKSKSTQALTWNLNHTLKPFNITIHELRHTFCTKLLMNGLDIGTTANIMGHNPKMTINVYNHINKEHIEKAQSLMKNIF